MYTAPPPVNMTEFPEEYDGCRGGQGRDSDEVVLVGWTDPIRLVRLITIVLVFAGVFYWITPQ